MSGSREEERRKLADIINHWNANRLDLFEISRPTEVGVHSEVAGEAADWPGPGAFVQRQTHRRLTLGLKCCEPSCCGLCGLFDLTGGGSPRTCMERTTAKLH